MLDHLVPRLQSVPGHLMRVPPINHSQRRQLYGGDDRKWKGDKQVGIVFMTRAELWVLIPTEIVCDHITLVVARKH